MNEAERRQSAGHGDCNHQRHQPGGQCEPSGPLTEQPKLQFVARQQKEEPQTDVGYQLDAGRVSPPQHLRSDQDPAHNENHHLRHPPGEQARHNRGQRGDQTDDEEVDQALLKTQGDHLPRTTWMAAPAGGATSS
jgi:hypothetical protein